MDPGHDVKCRILQAPWVLFFDGASRKPAEHAALGFVLKNSKGQVAQEGRRFLGGGISSELAKYKALIAGLKKAKSLQVKHLLVKGTSRLLVNQVVGWCAVKDAQLRDHLRKVWVISKEFDSLFMEFIATDQNAHAERIADAAIDKELQIQQVVTEYFDRNGAWPVSAPNKSAPLSPLPAAARAAPVAFSNQKLRSVSLRSVQHQNQNLNIPKPLPKSTLKTTAPVKSGTSEVTRTSMIMSFNRSKLSDSVWHEDLDRLSSISDESSVTESEEESYFKLQAQRMAVPSVPKTAATHVAAATTARSTIVNVVSDDDSDNGDDVDSSDNEENVSRRLSRTSSAGLAAPSVPSAVQLSEADYERLVTAVISRLKKTKLVDD